MSGHIEALAAAGWTAERKVDVDDIILEYRKAGYVISNDVVALVSNVSGLELTFESFGSSEFIAFDARLVNEISDPQRLEAYGKRIGSVVVPVGVASGQHLILMASIDGCLYGGFDDFLVELGDITDAVRLLMGLY